MVAQTPHPNLTRMNILLASLRTYSLANFLPRLLLGTLLVLPPRIHQSATWELLFPSKVHIAFSEIAVTLFV